MKYFFNLFVLNFLFIFTLNAQVSRNPIIGYDKVEWGTNISDLLKIYTDAKPGGFINKEGNSAVYRQTNVVGGISRREFSFYNDRLYMVTVLYRNTNSKIKNILLEKLEKMYGVFDDEVLHREGAFYFRARIKNFSNDMAIIFSYGTSLITIKYYNPIINNQIEEDLRNNKNMSL
jgi:hypothetical protein